MKYALAVVFLCVSVPAQNFEANEFGRSVAGLGDVDGDKRADIAVGGGDLVRAYSGKTGALLWSKPGDRMLARFGYTLASCDWNGDGRGDVVAASPGTTRHTGSVTVLCGTDGATLAFIESGVKGTDFGYALAAADLDGDKRVEIVVGAPRDGGAGAAAGAVFVYSGTELRHVVRGDEERAWLGASVAIAGDLDFDGVGEVLIGAPRARTRGQVLVMSGKTGRIVRTLDASEGDDHFGISLCVPRCPQRYPASLLAVGVDIGGSGLVRVFDGSNFEVTREICSHRLRGGKQPELADKFAYAIASVRGVGDDGCDALAVGAPSGFWNGSYYGSGFVFDVRSGQRLHETSWSGEPVHFGFGVALADAGDVDGDRRGDVVFGALDDFWGGGFQIASPAKRKVIHEWPKHEDE